MAGRKPILHHFCFAVRPASGLIFILACALLCILAGSLLSLRRASAQEPQRTATREDAGRSFGASRQLNSELPAPAIAAVNTELPTGTVLGEFQGSLDAKSGRLNIWQKGTGQLPKGALAARGDVNTPLPAGSFTLTLTNTNGSAPDSVFDVATGRVNGELQLTNNSGFTLYNTRLVFNAFKIGNISGADAPGSPASGGLAYYNDGQIAYGNQLLVSRHYGDIATGSSSRAIWTFEIPPSTTQTFYYSFLVLADIGVAAESVDPAAVQVSTSAGSTVNILGRGFGTNPAPTVQLISSGGATTALTVNSTTPSQLNVSIPAGTAAGIYSLRVTNSGGTPGGNDSSTILNRLTVTSDALAALAGTISSQTLSGSYLITGDATISGDVIISPGSVLYFGTSARLILSAGATLTANGGVPGVPGSAGVASPAQIVFTANRTPGQPPKNPGEWGGINATAAGGNILMRNCVIEYGGGDGAQMSITNSGRTLRFTDSICRRSFGHGIEALGANDRFEGFARSRVDNNGSVSTDVPVLLHANASLGLYDISTSGGGTFVSDPNYYYASANSFGGNSAGNFVQIGTDASASSNDFTRSGVLVGQGDIPIQIRGSSSNPAIVGGSSLVELSINPAATIQLASGTDLQAGSLAQGLRGGIAANGIGGVTIVPGAEFGSSRYITFDKTSSGGNFGALYFTSLASTSSVLNYVRVQNGGNSAQGKAAVIAEGINVNLTNSDISNSEGTVLALAGGNIISDGVTSSGTTLSVIDTIAGGLPGDGAPASITYPGVSTPAPAAYLGQTKAVAVDPLGRGIFIADFLPPGSASYHYIRFFNTSKSPVTLGGQRIPPGSVQTIAGSDNGSIGDNAPGLEADLKVVSGLAVSPDGNILYFTVNGLSSKGVVRALNISASAQTIAGQSIGSGNVGTLVDGSLNLPPELYDTATLPNGDVLFIDGSVNNSANPAGSKIYRVVVAGRASSSSAIAVALGRDRATGETINATSPAFDANDVVLYQPRAVETDSSGNFFVSDTYHGRVIRVDSGGTASLLAQFNTGASTSGNSGLLPNSLTVLGNFIYVAMANQAVIVRIGKTGSETPTIVAGSGTLNGTSNPITGTGSPCAGPPSGEPLPYTPLSACGDGGAATSAQFNFPGNSELGATAVTSDASGLYVVDQAISSRARLRYVNLSGGSVTLASTTIASGNIDAVLGGLIAPPFNEGPVLGANLNSPIGLALDANDNLYFTDTSDSTSGSIGALRFVNRGTSNVTIFAGIAGMEQVVRPGQITLINRSPNSGTDDGVSARLANFNTPQGMAVTSEGIYIADSLKGIAIPIGPSGKITGIVRFINTTTSAITLFGQTVQPGNTARIAGTQSTGTTTPDNPETPGPARDATLFFPTDVAVSPINGDIYITDPGNSIVRKVVRATGTISKVSGLTNSIYPGLAFDSSGRLYVVDHTNGRLLRETSAGSNTFETVTSGLNKPRDVVVDDAGTAYITNSGNSQIVKVTSGGTVSALAGVATTVTNPASSFFNYGGDRGPAISARLNMATELNIRSSSGTVLLQPTTAGIVLTQQGEVLFSDIRNSRIRRVR
jgi:sugar lactone lactonase YvrE